MSERVRQKDERATESHGQYISAIYRHIIVCNESLKNHVHTEDVCCILKRVTILTIHVRVQVDESWSRGELRYDEQAGCV